MQAEMLASPFPLAGALSGPVLEVVQVERLGNINWWVPKAFSPVGTFSKVEWGSLNIA